MHRLILALVTASVALLAVTGIASAKNTERLVVRGQDTVVDAPCSPAGCEMPIADGTFRGTTGSGNYTGSLKLDFADVYPNGEGGLCAPFRADIVLGAGTPDRLAVAVAGDSCQDGAGNPATSSFTATGVFAIKSGTGAYAKAHGGGLFTSTEDANDHERMTLMGRIAR
jgi:hypothetical protein